MPSVEVVNDVVSGDTRTLDIRPNAENPRAMVAEVTTSTEITALEINSYPVDLEELEWARDGSFSIVNANVAAGGWNISVTTRADGTVRVNTEVATDDLPEDALRTFQPRPPDTMPALDYARDPTVVTRSFRYLPGLVSVIVREVDNMNRRARTLLLVAVITLISLLAPVAALAQEVGTDNDGLLIRIDGPVTVAQGETVDNVVVIGDNATVDGTITGSLFVIDGDAIVNGEIGDDVTVVSGTLELASSAQVDNVSVIRGTLNQDPAATVGGTVTESEFQVSPWDWGVAWALFWLGTTIVFVVSGLIFAGIGGRQLAASGNAIVDRLGPTLLGVIVLWILVPIVMIAALLTVVGIPLSIGYFLFVLPVLWFLGYLVAGTLLGRLIVRSQREADHPYLAALIGIILLQIVSIIPVFGWMIAFIAAILGTGGMVVIAWNAWRGRRAEPERAEEEGGARAPA